MFQLKSCLPKYVSNSSVKADIGVHMRNLRRLAIIIGLLLGFIDYASPSFARGGINSDDPWNPEHIDQLPTEIRHALGRMCGQSMRADHYFVRYLENSRMIELHFEHFRCGDKDPLCTQSGCLHQIFVLSDGKYHLLKSYYRPENE